MASNPLPLTQTFARVVLDGSGNGIAQVGPTRAREHWQPSRASVSVATQVNESQCAVYLGNAISPATFVDSTPTGSTGDACGFNGRDMQTGEQIFAQWTGGDPGAVATVTIRGTYTIGAP